ncbi:MAG: hypothetical protein M3442_08665, partial [Chloroflexota bacterium]|nr:hypothetical protein [Chloroflexota bacterium]
MLDLRNQGVSVTPWHARRLERWCQSPTTRIPDASAAAEIVQRVGVATLFPVTPELPNLYHAHTGDPTAKPEAKWDSPAGNVYTWRWALGRPGVACYTALVLGRPTWVSWELLPAVLRLRDALRAPAELHAAGELSASAYRITQVLADCGGVLSTGDLRTLAGFPTGKAERAAYLKAVAELDRRLLLAKDFAAEDDDMRHALIHVRYPQHVAAAEELSPPAALDRFLMTYLPHAVYARSGTLAKGLTLLEADVQAGLQRLVAAGAAVHRSYMGP